MAFRHPAACEELISPKYPQNVALYATPPPATRLFSTTLQ